jgi:hypothetical protein
LSRLKEVFVPIQIRRETQEKPERIDLARAEDVAKHPVPIVFPDFCDLRSQ